MRTLCLLALVVAFVTPASAQPSSAPPDFSGLWRRDYRISEAYEPPASGPGPVVEDPRYPNVNHDGIPRYPLTAEERQHVIQYTAGWIPDLGNPILQPKTREVLEKIGKQELAGFPHAELQTMCMPPGTPTVLNMFNTMQVLQTTAEVLFLYAEDHHVRHVRLNQPHSNDLGRAWWGDSIGHYEGDTLVVDTVGENDKTVVDRFGTPHSKQLHVVERYRRSDNGRGIEVLLTVEDPIAFTTTWSAQAHYVPDREFFEMACAENERQVWPGRDIPFPVDNTPDF